MMPEIEMRKRNIIYIRAILSLVITLLAVYQLAEIMERTQYVAFYVVVLIASNFVFMLLPSRMYDGMKLHSIIFILDIVFITLGAYWLASLDFLFFMMIFVTIFISALSQSVKLSLLVALVVNIFYFYIKTMTAQNGGAAAEEGILLNIPFLFMVALHSSYMAEKASEDAEGANRLKKSNQALTGRVNEMNAELDAYTEYTGRIFDGFREGVIVIDNDGIIKQFNKKAEAIFGIRRNGVINFLYREVHELGDVIKLIADIKQKKLVSFEKEMTINTAGEIKKLTVNTAYINDKEDKIIGYLCTVRQKITGALEGV
jgi:PAS domain S-box-containing protein